MRIGITGAGGQLGTDLAAHCGEMGDHVIAWSRAQLDITDPDAVTAAIVDAGLDTVVNCAAWTAVDACEGDPDLAERVNGIAVGHLAEAAAAGGAHLVQISTDYVFDGTKGAPYLEDDTPSPASAYGRSKLMGERRAGADATVVRTSWVYSRHAGNMVATICRVMGEVDELAFVDDQVGHPTCTESLAIAVRRLAEARLAGVFHCTNAGAVSWFEFAQAVLIAAGESPDRVRPITTAELEPPRPAPRPADSRLSNRRYGDLFEPLPDFREGLEEVVATQLHRLQ